MMPPDIFSRSIRRRIAERVRAAPDADKWLLEYMAGETLARLSAVNRRFETALLLGHRMPQLVAGLQERGIALRANDVVFDEDRPPFRDGSFDLILVNGALDTVNDLPGALLLIRRMLRPDGLFAGSMIGAGSLPTLRQAMSAVRPAPRFHPQIEVRAMGDLLLRAGYFQPVVDCETIDARYPDLAGLVRDLRANGLSNALPQRLALSRAEATKAQAAFSSLARHGKTAEQFSIIHMTGWSSAAR